MCGWCGDSSKPACDQDPDCSFHCFGGEHLDELESALDDFQRIHYERLDLAGVNVMSLAGQVPSRPTSTT